MNSLIDTHNSTMAYDVPVVSVRYARRFLRFLESQGIGRQVILERSGVDGTQVTQVDGFLSIRQILSMLEAADALLADERAPFRFGQQLDLLAHGLMGFALLRQKDQKQLVNMIVQYLRVALPIMDLELNAQGPNLGIRLCDSWDLGPLRPFIVKIYMGSIHSLASLVSRDVTFEFDFSTGLTLADWQALVPQARVRFDADDNQVLMPLSGRPLRDEDVDLAYFLAGVRSREQVQSREVEEVIDRVREQIMQSPGRDCSLERVAQQLGISPRSVRRHLALAGSSFRDIRNEVRQTFATRYLTDTTIPLETIAEKLGFSDQASFTRAYRTWTGRTPGSVRRRARSQS